MRNRATRRLSMVAGAFLAVLTVPNPGWAAEGNPNATIVFYDAVGNETLDPAHPQSNSSFAQDVLLAIYDPLIRLNDRGEPTPGLAESWSYNADLTEFTMTLRKGVVFHDGAKLTADAVKRNLERSIALGNRAGTSIIETVKLIDSVEAVGDNVVKLKLKRPNGQLEYWLGFVGGLMISPNSLTEGAFGVSLKPVGAGPFKVASFESNVRTKTVRFDAYWGGTKGRAAGFDHHYVPDGRARINALRSGQANVVLIDPSQIPEAKSAGLQVQINEKNGVWDIYLNLSRKGISDVRVRRALMYAIDRKALADALTYGASKPTLQLFSSASPVYDKELDTIFPFDQAKARSLLAEAGFKNGIEITQLLLNTSEYRRLAEALQAMLGEVGITLKFDTVDASQFPLFRRPPGRGDILMARWGGRPDPLQVFQELVATGAAYNPVGVASPRIDTLIAEAARLAPDNPKRLKTLHELSRVVIEDVANVPIMTRSNVYAYQPGCILNLTPYLATGDDRFNDVLVGTGCQ